MTPELWLMALGIVILLACSAFFSSSETALMTARKARLHDMIAQGSKGAELMQKLTEKPDLLLGTILLGNNAVNIGASALATSLFLTLFGEIGVVYATLVMTLLVLIFCEVLPKTAASLMPESLGLWVVRPMQGLTIVLRPLTEVVRVLCNFLLRLLGIRHNGEAATFTDRDLRGAIGLGHAEGVLADTEHRMLGSILDLGNLPVEEVMTHRGNMTSIDVALSLEEVSAFISSSAHTRIPVWEENPDNIIGILHVRDFLNAFFKTNGKTNVRELLQPAYFIPESTDVHKQMLEFRRLRRHLALVVDEYGDLLGLVTLEDIVEEIVGDIIDEHDREHPEYIRNADGTLTLAGSLTVREANREFGWALPEEGEAFTLAGLIFEQLGHIPKAGEYVTFENITLHVMAMRKRTILSVKAEAHPQEGEDN